MAASAERPSTRLRMVTVSARVIGSFGRNALSALSALTQPCASAVCTALYAQWVAGTSAKDFSVPMSLCGKRVRMVTNSARVIEASGRKVPSS